MLSDEEKKAIGQCRLLLNGDITLHIIDDDGGTAYCGIVNKEYNKDLETVLNLIEKQSKEIEELKKYKKYYKEMEEVNKKFIAVDKIKAKIEEYKELSNNVTMQPQIYSYIVDVLQSLLEKE